MSAPLPPDAPRPSSRRTKAAPASEAPQPRVDIALQGGGSHGAFTWGVLDRLLQPGGLDFAAISGTSAGAMNGAVMATGYVKGHALGGVLQARESARRALADFWKDVSHHGPWFTPLLMQAEGLLLKPSFNFSQLPGFRWMDLLSRAFSPYETNPLNLNPLKGLVEDHVDTDLVRAGCPGCGMQLFVAATSVETGQARVFSAEHLTIDAILASACLPLVFQAVEIEGEGYWDGGYTGNPALYPLIYNTEVADVLLVRINPLRRPGKPTRSGDIVDRLSEITFNTSLVGEMRAIAFVQRLMREGKLDPTHYKSLRMHMIADDEGLAPFDASSKSNTAWTFLQELHGLGHAAADRWLKQHRADVGLRNTLDIEATFLSQ